MMSGRITARNFGGGANKGTNGISGFALVQSQITVVPIAREDSWEKKIQSPFIFHNFYWNDILPKMEI